MAYFLPRTSSALSMPCHLQPWTRRHSDAVLPLQARTASSSGGRTAGAGGATAEGGAAAGGAVTRGGTGAPAPRRSFGAIVWSWYSRGVRRGSCASAHAAAEISLEPRLFWEDRSSEPQTASRSDSARRLHLGLCAPPTHC